jgi:thiol-disulfide isomerase/thioredoxin
MRKIITIMFLLWSTITTLQGQSMYGAEVEADVKMKYVYSFEEALTLAKQKNKLIFFNCFADWATPCHGMNKKVFSNQEFADWMDANFINFFTDVTKGPGKTLAEKYNVHVMAHYLVLDANGEVVHRIIGGSEIPEFKGLLEKSLNPKTSLKGMNAQYDKGKYKLDFLREYFLVLRVAGENDRAVEVLDKVFTKLKPQHWSKKENWKVFSAKVKKVDDEYFSFLIKNKDNFEHENGAEVYKLISRLYNNHLFAYANGGLAYNSNEMLDLFLNMQKAGLGAEDNAFVLYKFAKLRGEKDLKGMIKLLNQQKDIWDSNQLRLIDLSLSTLKDLSKEDIQLLTYYWQSRADSFKGTTGNHYRMAIKNLNNTDGIVFAELTFQEALDKAAAEGKQVFVDCYTTWCGPCKWLDANTFKEKIVGDYINKHFISVKIDMERGEGVQLSKKYSIQAFPTMLVLDNKGEVVKRVVGAMDGKKLLTAIK